MLAQKTNDKPNMMMMMTKRKISKPCNVTISKQTDPPSLPYNL